MNNNSASNIKNKQNEYNSLGYQPKIFNVNSNKTIKIRRLMNPYLLRTMPHPSHSLYKSDEKRIYTSDFKTRKDKSQSSLSFADNHLLRLTQNLIYKHTDQNSQKKHRFTVQLMKNLDVLKEKKAIKSRKREILSLTGSMKSTKLRNLMQNELTNNQDFYSLGFLNYKNYKYIKPDKLCMDIFGTELELPKLGKEKEFKFIETFYETIKNKPLKQVHPQKHVFNNDNELNQTQNNRSIRIQNTIRSKTSVNNRKKNDFILKDLQESENRENTQEKEIKNILPYTIDKNDKLEIFMKTYFPKDPHMINEYFKLCNISKKLYFHCKNNENQNFKDKETFLNDKNYIFVVVLKNYYSGFLNRNPIIIDRILLALNITPNNSFGIIELEKYFKLVRLSYVVDNQLKDLINFVIKFFKIEKNCEVTKSEFFRLFKLLTQQIDMKGEENNIRKSLFDNFIENYYMTGVIMMDGENVNFDKFRKVYENYQMNIYDIVDLIFGRV